MSLKSVFSSDNGPSLVLFIDKKEIINWGLVNTARERSRSGVAQSTETLFSLNEKMRSFFVLTFPRPHLIVSGLKISDYDLTFVRVFRSFNEIFNSFFIYLMKEENFACVNIDRIDWIARKKTPSVEFILFIILKDYFIKVFTAESFIIFYTRPRARFILISPVNFTQGAFLRNN